MANLAYDIVSLPMPRYSAEKDAPELKGRLASLAMSLGERREALRLDGEVALWRSLVEQCVAVYEMQFAAYQAAIDADPDLAHQISPPSVREIGACLEGLQKCQATMAKIEQSTAIPRDTVVMVLQRIRQLITAYVPEAERQRAILSAVGKIDVKF